MITDRDTLIRLAALNETDGIPPDAAMNISVALLHAMTSDGRRAAAAAMIEGTPEHRRLVGVHVTRAVVHAWHGLLGNADWRSAYDSRGSS